MDEINYTQLLNQILSDIQPYRNMGQPADYIPLLRQVDPDQFGMCLCTLQHKQYTIGQAFTPFSIQSISKVFSLAMCLSQKGEGLWTRLGKEPSGTAFNSLIQLEMEHGRPRNPFINAGALVLTDILLSMLADPMRDYLEFVRALCGDDSISFNAEMAASEFETSYLNAAIVNLMKHHHNIVNDVNDVLRFYLNQCAIEMNCCQLSRAFLAFADHTRGFDYAGWCLTPSQVKRINAVMQTCGFYDEAGEFSYKVGLPGKSGVGGGIVAIYPLRYAVAVWSPRLNEKGNSIMGMKALELLTTHSRSSIF